jgi:hypothetical protein
MRAEMHPESIRFTSDRFGFDGFRVLVRELLDEDEANSGRRGHPHFRFSCRPVQEKGCTTVLFQADPDHPMLTNRIAVLLPPDEPYRGSWRGAAGKIGTFEVHPHFLEEVLRRAGIPASGLRGLPPARFAINRQVEGLCQLLMRETEKRGPTGRLYFENLATALVVAVVSQSDPRLPEAGNLEAQQRRLQRAIALMQANLGFHYHPNQNVR